MWGAEGGKTGSVWISWSTGIPSFINNTAQLPQLPAPSANRYTDDYPQPPRFQFAPQTQDPASVASQVLRPRPRALGCANGCNLPTC